MIFRVIYSSSYRAATYGRTLYLRIYTYMMYIIFIHTHIEYNFIIIRGTTTMRDDDDVCSRLERHNYLLIQLDRGRFYVSLYLPPLHQQLQIFLTLSHSLSPSFFTIFPLRLTRSLGQSLLNQTRAKTIINQRRTRWRRIFSPL